MSTNTLNLMYLTLHKQSVQARQKDIHGECWNRTSVSVNLCPQPTQHHQRLHGPPHKAALNRLFSTAAAAAAKMAGNGNNNNNKPSGNSVFFFRMNKGAKAFTKKYRTEIAASISSVLSTFAAFPLDFAKSRMQSYNTTFTATVTLIIGSIHFLAWRLSTFDQRHCGPFLRNEWRAAAVIFRCLTVAATLALLPSLLPSLPHSPTPSRPASSPSQQEERAH